MLLRLAIVGAFSLEIPRLFAVILGLFITTLIYSTSVAAKLWFLSPTRLQKNRCRHYSLRRFIHADENGFVAPNIQTSIINEFISTVAADAFSVPHGWRIYRVSTDVMGRPGQYSAPLY